jgi:hypothetical protein
MFCFNKIEPEEVFVELKIGKVHEECYLKRRLVYYRSAFLKIDDLPSLERRFWKGHDRWVELMQGAMHGDIDRMHTDEIYDDWAKVSKSMGDIELFWFTAKFYLDQRSRQNRLAAWLMERPFTYSKTHESVAEWHSKWAELLTVFTDFLNLDVEPVFSGEIGTISGLRTKKDCEKRINVLLDTTRAKAEEAFTHAILDVSTYQKDLQKEYQEWKNENHDKLVNYDLLSVLE